MRARYRPSKMAASPAEVQKFLSNTTANGLEYASSGIQIEYLAADGRTFLWYPGNAKVLPGRWKLQKASYGLEMCFLYGEAATGHYHAADGGWECDISPHITFWITMNWSRATRCGWNASRCRSSCPRGSNVSIAQAMNKAGFGKLRAANKALAPQYPTGN